MVFGFWDIKRHHTEQVNSNLLTGRFHSLIVFMFVLLQTIQIKLSGNFLFYFKKELKEVKSE